MGEMRRATHAFQVFTRATSAFNFSVPGACMARTSYWHGTQEETGELLNTIARHCACVLGARGERMSICSVHRMLITDQRALDGLLFARRIAGRLRWEEGLV
jgi:hypothetical protein